MFGQPFNHEVIRKCIGIFGALFNNMYIVRKGKSGAGVKTVKVPLSFAPKRKFLDEINKRNSDDRHDENVIAVTLPRMSFEHIGINYDPSRQLPKMNSCIVPGTSPSTRNRIYTKTPYNIQFSLNIYTKTHADALQIIEQIFPYFTPQYTISMKPLDDHPTIIDDVPLVINGVSYSDDYEGPMEARRTIIYTIDFDMRVNFYGPERESKIIEKADIDFFFNSVVDSNTEIYVPASTYSVTTDPRPVSPDSDYTFVETLTNLVDSI
jgi:hypothetical protein